MKNLFIDVDVQQNINFILSHYLLKIVLNEQLYTKKMTNIQTDAVKKRRYYYCKLKIDEQNVMCHLYINSVMHTKVTKSTRSNNLIYVNGKN